MVSEQSYEDRYWQSEDGLQLHYRDYPGPADKRPVLCIPGLTRNARDFEHFGGFLAGKRRLLSVNLRGRGGSEYAKDSATYRPPQYVADILTLLDEQQIEKAIFFGTSLGGIVTMLTAGRHPHRIAAALLNDIGPEIDQVGLDRIGGTVGQSRTHDTWVHAARAVAESNRDIYPDFGLEQWIAFAKKLNRLKSGGWIQPDYDPKISEPFRSGGGGNSKPLWDGLDNLKDKPVLIVRGATSDLFGVRTAKHMMTRLDNAELVEVPRVGHAPTLEEPEVLAAVDRLLAQVD